MTLVVAVGWLVALFAALWTVFKEYLVRSHLDNIPGPKRTSFWKGNIVDMYNRWRGWDFHDRLIDEFPAVSKIHGNFGSRQLYVYDPKALNSIIVKDQMVYEEPRWFISMNMLTFGEGLLSTLGDHHRRQRKLLNPVFSINHMRHMTPIFYRTVHRLRQAVASEVGDTSADVNVLEWMGRTALELVGQGGLGYSFDPLVKDTKNAYGDALKEVQPLFFALHFWRLLFPYVVPYIPAALGYRLSSYLPNDDMQRLRKVVKEMDSQSRSIYYKKKADLENGVEAVVEQIDEGKDIMSILMKANMEAKEEDRLPEDELLGQMSTLVFAATDTTSNALSRILHLLAMHPEVQEKTRAEILEASPDGEDIPYDDLVALPYLDAVCRETLRLHPPINWLSRETRADIVMPLSEPIQGVDGTMIHEIPVPKNTNVVVGIRACNRNKALWGDDAKEWKPERWLAPLPEAVSNAHVPGVYSNLMTFLGGGRACIGFKFSQLEMKVVLAVMLRSFKFSLGEKPIFWNLAGVNYPSVGKNSSKAAMYLKLEPVEA